MDVSLELFREYNICVVIYLKLLQMLYINFFFENECYLFLTNYFLFFVILIENQFISWKIKFWYEN